MPRWNHKIRIRHLLTENEDHQSVQASMNAIADALSKYPCMLRFDARAFRKIPAGDDVITPLDYANKLLERLYDYCDANRILG